MKKVIVDETKCIRCGACMRIAADVFTYGSDGESVPTVDVVDDDNKDAINAMESCPTGAIILSDADGSESSLHECEYCECGDCDCEDCGCEDECEECEECGHAA